MSSAPAPRPESPRRPTRGAVGPGWRGVGICPQSPSGDSGIGFQPGQRRVGRIPFEPPRVTSPDQLLAQAPAVGETDLGDESSVAVALFALDGHDLAEGQPREVLLSAGRIRLASLGGVDPAEPDDLRSARPKHGERVPVSDADDLPGERLGGRLADQQKRAAANARRCHTRARLLRVFRTAAVPYPPDALGSWVGFRYSSRSAAVPSLPWITWTRTERTWPSTGARTSLRRRAWSLSGPRSRDAPAPRPAEPTEDRLPPCRGSRGRPTPPPRAFALVDRGLPQPQG